MEATKTFLGHFPNYLLVTIQHTDSKVYHNFDISEADELNMLRRKGDIYFTPNGDYQFSFPKDEHNTKSIEGRQKTGRTAANARNIYAFIADIDNKDEVWKNYDGLDKPTYVIETSHGHHVYYVLEKPLLYDDFKKEFKDIEERFVALFKSDPKCTDISRILRVPGYKYWKDNLGEFDITIKEDNGTLFDFKDIAIKTQQYYKSAGKDIEEKKVLTKKIKDRTIAKSFEDFFDDVQRLSVDDVLLDLMGNVYEIKSGGAIYEGGKKTDGYKFCKRGNFINTFSDNDRPVGGPYSVAKFYYKNTSDTIDYFCKRWNIEFKRFDDMKRVIGDTTQVIEKPGQTSIRQNKKYGNSVNGVIIDYENEKIIQYYDKGESEYVNGIVDCYGVYRNGDQKRYIIVTEKGGQRELRTLPLIGGGSDLRKFLMGMGLIVGESKQGLIFLLKYLTSIQKEYLYTDKMGMQYIDGHKVIVTKGGVYIDEDQQMFVNIPETTGEFLHIEESTETIEQFVTKLVSGYKGEISFVTFLAICLGVNSWFFRDQEIKLPQFFLMGLSQTGKSTFLENLFIKGMGLKMELSASSKPFVRQKMSKHYMPIHFCEYRNTNIYKEDIEGQMRILFDGTEGTKGKSDQSVVYYPSNAMFMIDGQATFTDDAALTRLFLLIANPKDKGSLDDLESLPNILDKILNIFKDMDDFKKFITLSKKYRKEIKQKMKLSRENDRMIDNYSFIYALSDRLGLRNYNNYLDECMSRQDSYLALDDIKMTYQKCFNLQQIHKFDMYISRGGLVIDIVEEYLKSNNIHDLKGMIKTVNQHFITEGYPFIGMEVYVDLEYIYKNKQLWNPFIRSLKRLSLSGEYTKEEIKTIDSLKVFLEHNFNGHDTIKQINFELNSIENRSVKSNESEF